MDYMARHGATRARPAELVPGTLRVITARIELPAAVGARERRGARGSRRRRSSRATRSAATTTRCCARSCKRLALRIRDAVGEFGYRVFTDSAPVLEVALAARSGLGWQGKHTLLLTREAGSWFFLGEIYTDLPLPLTRAESAHCGSCTACIDVCPTGAIVAPYSSTRGGASRT